MIFYFSATGNNKYVASKIAEATGGCASAVSIAARRMQSHIRRKQKDMGNIIIRT